MGSVGSLVGSVVQDALEEGFGDSEEEEFAYPDSTIAVYDATDSSGYTVTSSPDVDALLNQHDPGAFEPSQSTAGKKPHASSSHIAFDGSDDTLHYAGANLLEAGSHFSYFVIAELGTPTFSDYFFYITASAARFQHRLKYDGTEIEVTVLASEGTLTATAAFTPGDGERHLFGVIFDAAGVSLSIDGVRTTTALANTGTQVAYDELAVGATAADGSHGPIDFLKGAVLVSPTESETNDVETQLLSEVP